MEHSSYSQHLASIDGLNKRNVYDGYTYADAPMSCVARMYPGAKWTKGYARMWKGNWPRR